ncbi:MAG TPA: SDR family NAD(P)-dependent oxidoreductase, partial [Pseudomonadales bacterium]|nr:SDR family NAD(P)-dependent oxidoreductase [Pseudomonadales bacterium]
IVINNAGITSTKVFPEVDAEELQLHLGVHVLGSVNMMRAAWPHMVAQKSGKIINTASSSLLGFCPQITYPSMKAALLGLTRNTALVGKDHNICVNAVLPAAFTRMSGLLPQCDFRDHLERDFLPEKLAPVVSYLCHEECDISGEFFSVGGGKFTRLVFAETDVASVDMTMESVASSIGAMMKDDAKLQIIKTSFDDLKMLGFSDEECEIFRNMTATQSSAPEFENFEAVSKNSIENVWDLTIKSMVGDQKSVLTLKSDGKTLAGNTHSAEYGTQELIKGDFDGKKLVWKTKISKPVPMTLTYTASIDAKDNLKGTVKLGMFGESNFIGVLANENTKKEAQQRFQAQLANAGTKKLSFIEKLFSRKKEEVE